MKHPDPRLAAYRDLLVDEPAARMHLEEPADTDQPVRGATSEGDLEQVAADHGLVRAGQEQVGRKRHDCGSGALVSGAVPAIMRLPIFERNRTPWRARP